MFERAGDAPLFKGFLSFLQKPFLVHDLESFDGATYVHILQYTQNQNVEKNFEFNFKSF